MKNQIKYQSAIETVGSQAHFLYLLNIEIQLAQRIRNMHFMISITN